MRGDARLLLKKFAYIIAVQRQRPQKAVKRIGGVAHVGVYVGNGWVIECAGGRGAIRTPLAGSGATRWTAWFECPFIDYGAAEQPSSESTTLKVGDTVRVKQGAAPWNGGRLASWVYSSTFELMELKGERAVIGKGGAVTTAINVKNLVVQ